MAHKANLRVCMAISIFFLTMAGLAQAATITVGPGAGYDYDTIQTGIDSAVDADIVLVAPGEYVITEPVTFRGKAITVKSEAGSDDTTIRMGTPADNNRGSVVVFENGETAASILEGFTITGGVGSWVSSANAYSGGGIYFDASSGSLMNCAVVKNRADNGGGGGVSAAYRSSPILTDCIFTGNSAMWGGGLLGWINSSITMTNCIISGNSSLNLGGGVYGGSNSSITMTNCTIISNTVQDAGAGIVCDSSSAILTNCVIAQNTGARWGGGLCSGFALSSITISNCTIWGNSAGEGGGIGCLNGASATVTNSIFWSNTAHRGDEIFLEESPTRFSVAYSNVAGGQAGVCVQGASTLDWGEGNIDADPCFADPNNGDFHLKSQAGRWTSASSVEPDPNSQAWVQDDVTSLCIDAGDPNSDWSAELWPHGERINMGAYGGTREASMSTQPQSMSLPTVAYIYLYDMEAAESFRSFLMGYGCSTTLIDLDQVATAPLDLYELIIVADDTQYMSTWDDPQTVAAIETSGKPVIGLGEGGYDFFGVLGLSIGRPNGMHDSRNSIDVIDPNHLIFIMPYLIDVPENRILQLYTETNEVTLYLWPVPENVKVLAGEVDQNGYYPLAFEPDRHVLWGFTEPPQKMTEVGKDLFINIVIWTANAGWEMEI